MYSHVIFMGAEKETKRQRYLNIFVLVGRYEDSKTVVDIIDRISREYGCGYEMNTSFLGNILYIKVFCSEITSFDDIRSRVDEEFTKYINTISWYKIEAIEIR